MKICAILQVLQIRNRLFNICQYNEPVTATVKFMQSLKPLSPHLQIYRLPLTAILSILHRISGVLLALCLVVFTVWLVSAAVNPELYEQLTKMFSGWVWQAALFGSTGALYLHLANGVRHLFWDAGYGFAVKTVNRSDALVILFTVLATVLTWIIVLMIRGMP